MDPETFWALVIGGIVLIFTIFSPEEIKLWLFIVLAIAAVVLIVKLVNHLIDKTISKNEKDKNNNKNT
jgi:diacylglycerol kinase